MLTWWITEVESKALMRRHALLTLASTLLYASCAPTSPAPTPAPTVPAAASSPAQQPAPSVAPAVDPARVSPEPDAAQAARTAALAAAALQLQLPSANLSVDQLEPRQWPDASLGCPRQGVLYAQVLTPGFLIVVSGGGKSLEYHSDNRGRVVLCQER